MTMTPTYTPTATPTETPTPEPTAVPTVAYVPQPTPYPPAAALNRAEMVAVYEQAGVPAEWREPLMTIALCESNWIPTRVGDGGNSLGLHQLNWATWFPHALSLGLVTEADRERWADPYVNTRVAIGTRTYLGRFGGTGGWTCAGSRGIW